jgi:hypothetical protein
MAKPQVQARVEPRQKKRVTDMVDDGDGDGEFETQAEAVRHLIDRGLDYEEGHLAAADGGLAPEEVEALLEAEVGGLRDDLADEISRNAAREAVRDTGTVLSAVLVALWAAGQLAGPALVVLGLVALVLLTGPSVWSWLDARETGAKPAGEEAESA